MLLCTLRSEDFQILCVPCGRIHGRTPGCNSLLKVRKGNYKRERGVTGGSRKQRVSFSLPGAFKTYANLKEGKNLVGRGLGGPWAR
jgi:hypothetical protein